MDCPPCKLRRLRLSAEFRQVRECGESFVGRWIVLGIFRQASSELEEAPRFGVVTSRKVGGAVVRNRVRRRLREIHLLHRFDVLSGVWCVAVARFRASLATYQELNAEWVKLAVRAGILRRCPGSSDS